MNIKVLRSPIFEVIKNDKYIRCTLLVYKLQERGERWARNAFKCQAPALIKKQDHSYT